LTAPAAVFGLSLEERDAIRAFLESTKSDPANGTSHGALDIEELTRMLLEDVALAVLRPGSWEGHGMRQLLASHGYTALDADEGCAEVRRTWWGGDDPYRVPR
jgi:hypothetical protein